ncbi:hypothetical protein ACWGJP_07465 [Microbacterium sp. NPDC055903]
MTTQRRPGAGATIEIGDARLVVAFDGLTGGLVSLRDEAEAHWLAGIEGGSLFVLEVPRGGDRTVVVATGDQQLSESETDADGRTAVLRWRDPITSRGERLTGVVEARAIVEDGALRLSLAYSLDHAPVEAVRFPSIRGLRPSSGRLELRGVDYSTGTRVGLLPRFDSNAPYWGTMFPDYASGNLRPEVVGNPTSPFVILASEESGLTVLPTRPTLDFIGWRASLEPGFADSMVRSAGADAAVTLDAIHFPAGDGTASVLPDMSVAPYLGGWQEGTRVYRRAQQPTRRSGASWLESPRSWLQVQLMSTEGEVRYDFDALVGIIEECAAAGIGAIQIVGWNEGGQDGLVPIHRVSRKLGGESGLRRALQRAQELDVKTVLYVKYVWVEKPGPVWDEFEPFVARDTNGQPYAQPGPVYHSSRKRYGISTPWYVPLCFGVPEVREGFAEEIAGLAALGADGVLADESLYHGRSLLCFAEGHGHAPGESSFRWDGVFLDDVRRRLGDRADSFVLAGEGAYDAQFEHYDLSYFRSASPGHVPVGRMLRPGAAIVTALTGFDDRSMVNQALMYGYGLSFEPYNFKGRPGDMPDTVRYGVQMDALRAELADWLWRGELVEIADGVDAGLPEGVRRARWRAANGSTCLVLVNQGDRPQDVALDDGAEHAELRRPEEPRPTIPESSVRILPGGAAVIR